MEPNADKLRGLRITSLDDDEEVDDEPELPHQPLPAVAAAVDYEDYDDDEEEEAEVMLGLLEEPKRPGHLLRHLFPSKAGGIPAWLDPVNLPSGNSSCCGFCGEPLHFVLQIYAPIGDNEAATFHRTLFMFMCPSMECLHRDQHEQWTRKQGNPRRSVKVFRCQLPRSNAFYSSEPPKHNNSDKPLCAGVPARTSWTEYKITIDNEADSDSDSCDEDESNSKSLVMKKHCKPDDVMQSWMDQFEADADNQCWANFQQRISRAPRQVLR
ncbi:hypothetical protein ACQ4PT_039744 [Festuca glaucescens]